MNNEVTDHLLDKNNEAAAAPAAAVVTTPTVATPTVASTITTIAADEETPYKLFETADNENPSPPLLTFDAPTPIVVNTNDDGPHHDLPPPPPKHQYRNHNHNHHHQNNNNNNTSDEMSLATQKTFSTTDGVDIVVGSSPPPTNFVEWNQTFAGRIVRDKRFKRLVLLFILLNSLVLGLMTFDFVTNHRPMIIFMDTLDTVFLILFTMEIGLQVVHYSAGGWQNFLRQGWLVLDILIVGASLICNTLLVLRAFRVVRTLRLATRVEELRRLALTLLQVFPKMLAMLALLSLMFYIFAVVFTNLFHDLYLRGVTTEDYFSRLDITAFTLFSMMTLDGWSTIAREVMSVHGWAWIFFLAFVIVSVVVVFHLMMAICIETALTLYEERFFRIKETPSMSSQVTPAGKGGSEPDVVRLERKLEELTAAMHRIAERQVIVQDMLVLEHHRYRNGPERWENEPQR